MPTTRFLKCDAARNNEGDGYVLPKEDDGAEDDRCPVCLEPLKADDMCSTDIELGICHAACLEGSPCVDVDTGEQLDGPISTYRYGDLDQPKDPANG